MNRNFRERSKITYNESSTDEESFCSDDSELEDSSDEEDESDEVDVSNSEDELGPDDFDTDEESGDCEFANEFIQWNKKHPDPNSFENVERGRLEPGLLYPVLDCRNIVDFFLFFIDNTMLQQIVDRTNTRHEENLTIEELQ